MANTVFYNQEQFTITSGATGSFSFLADRAMLQEPVYSSGPDSLTGTFNGQQITGFSNYGGPANAVEDTRLYPNGGTDLVDNQGLVATKGYVNDPHFVNGISFSLADGSNVHISLFDTGDNSGFYPLRYITSSGGSGSITLVRTETQVMREAPCFLRGTLIQTVEGEVAVEELQEGSLILTHEGALLPVRWLGHTILHPHRRPEPRAALPICIRTGAISDNIPSRDLRVSPGHALLIGDVLINAGELVNGATIVQEEVDVVHYYHVELDSHDILIADGMPCESYLDDGNRASFLNGADHIRLDGRIDRASEATCRPLVKDGPLLIEAREKLLARAIALGWTRAEQPELRLEAGDVVVEPVAVSGRRYWFALPGEGVTTLRLRCAAAIVNRIAPDLTDDRCLGVALGALKVNGEPVDLASASFGAGFYPLENDGCTSWRWMDGNATLAFGTPARMIELDLQIIMPCLHRAPEAAEAREELSAAG